jgi:photosystem II stability/assembly factor-like uncharacterized protein
MKTSHKAWLSAIASLFILTGQACSGGGGVNLPDNGGLFKSIDRGTTWTQQVDLLTTGGQIRRFVDSDIRPILFDPADHESVFATSNKGGLFYSEDGGLSWKQDEFHAQKYLISVAIDHFDRCKWVVASQGKVYRTLDCGRGWREMLSETRAGVEIVEILTDHFNQNVLYVFNTNEVLKSTDYGETWRTLHRFGAQVADSVMDARDSRVLYVATWGDGVWKTADGGATWTDVTTTLADSTNGQRVRRITQSVAEEGVYYVATPYGLHKTTNGGEAWESLELLTPPNAVTIRSFDVAPTDPRTIMYATDSSLYISQDAGATWKTLQKPTARRIDHLTFDFKDANVVFLGTKKVEQ